MRHGTWGHRWRSARALIAASCALLVHGEINAARAAGEAVPAETSARQHVWVLDEGYTTISFNRDEMTALGLEAAARRKGDSSKHPTPAPPRALTLTTEPGSRLVVEESPDGINVVSAELRHSGDVELDRGSSHGTIRAFTIADDSQLLSGDLLGRDGASDRVSGLWLRAVTIEVDVPTRTVTLWTDEVTFAPELARALGLPARGGNSIGTVLFEGRFRRLSTEHDATALDDTLLDFGQTSRVTAGGSIGPDVIVIALQGINSYGSIIDPDSLERISAFAVATTSCNIGDEPAVWVQRPSDQHPVIAQNLYRLKDNRFEQIGMSWVKHGFFAVLGNQCGDCIPPPGPAGDHLGVGCSDPYGAGLNGTQSNLGPRSTVNAFTGSFPTSIPPNEPNVIDRRLQVRTADVDPDLNPGAKYFVEGHYVTPDDAAAGNQFNNVAYRAATPVHANLGNNFCNNPANVEDYDMCLIAGSATHSEEPAIHAWKANDAAVYETEAFVPGEGLFRVSGKATDLGNGFWHYEYAVYNMNSHRSAASFRVPLPLGAAVENTGFHAPFYHSGDPYDGTPWTVDVQDDAITWSTQSYEQNQNANALRWGTLYNFWMDVGVGPAEPSTSATIGLFRPGSPTIITATTVGPSAGFRDCNANMVDDPCDIACDIPGCDQHPCGGSADCNDNGLPDECEPDCNSNDIADQCDIRDMTSADCDANGVPDECDPDCDGDGTPDACEVDLDADDDGVVDCEDLCPDSTPPDACLCPSLDRCCFSVGICIPNYPRNECISQSGTPDCQLSPCRDGCLVGDGDSDGDLDARDMSMLLSCFSGFASPAYQRPSVECLVRFDFDGDSDVDIDDFRRFRGEISGPGPQDLILAGSRGE